MPPPLLFDSSFLSKLEQLYLLSKKIFRGQHRAERKSRQTGSSLEFADYRNYSFGDDPRSIDWNIYGRLDRLFIKLFEEEEDLHIYFLIDSSASMASPVPGADSRPTKLDHARRIAASLAYIGLANLDRVNIFHFDRELGPDMGMARGKSQFHKILQFLRRTPAEAGVTSLAACFRTFSQKVKRRGLVFVISDLLDPAGYDEALALLRHNQFEVHVVQVLDPLEVDPQLSGDLRLTDSETSAAFDVTADPSLLRRYRETIASYIETLETFCLKRQIAYIQASTAIPFEDLVLRVLRDGRLVK